jgi:hypothetical protein
MPRYFFHLVLDGTTLPDPEGQELRDADEAWDAARAAAINLMDTSFERAVNWLNCLFEVRDEAGEVVLELPFREAVTSKEQPN